MLCIASGRGSDAMRSMAVVRSHAEHGTEEWWDRRGKRLQLLLQHLRFAAAALVGLAARARQVLGRAELVAGLLHEVIHRLRREAEDRIEPRGPGLLLGEAHQLQANPLILVTRIDVNAGDLGL